MFLRTVKSVAIRLDSCQPHRNHLSTSLALLTTSGFPYTEKGIAAMFNNEFTPAMTGEEYLAGETRHAAGGQSRMLAMAAGLTKSSNELKKVWESNSELYMLTLKGAIAAYDENKNLEELQVGAIGR